MFKSVVHLLFLMLLCAASQAQGAATDTARMQTSYPESIFYNALGVQSPLYNGREYVDVSRTKGHPFFVSDQFAKATLCFDGLMFRDVPVLYDIVQDEVILRNHEDDTRFVLNPVNLQNFIVHGHQFVMLPSDSVNQIPAGIYDKLYDRGIVLLCKRKKVINEKVTQVISREVVQKDLYYVLLDGTYHQVNTHRQLLNVFGKKRKEIRDHLRKQKVKFRKQPETALIKAAEMYIATN